MAIRTWRWRAPLALAGAIGVAGGFLAACGGGEAVSADPAGASAEAGVRSDTEVETENGAVRGAIDDELLTFKGIPFAAPPVGELRWEEPQPPRSWSGVREATESGPACVQDPGELPEGSATEDCLYLDITRPAAESSESRPVVVWVHGGGFFMGAGSNYDAGRLAERGDVVVVTVNYRLGIFGYFGHPGMPGSGTFGLSDQQAALSWVQRNIAEFGGDADNITLAGQSAGAISACAQLTAPSSVELFDKVVMQSGSCDLDWPRNAEYRGQPASAIFESLPEVQDRGRQAAGDLGCTGEDPAVIECLRELPVETVRSKLTDFILPAYGTEVLPVEPAQALRSGEFHRVPVLSGHTRNEATLATSMYDSGQPMSAETYDAVLTETFGADRAEVEARYPLSSYGSAAEAWAAIVTDRKWTCTQYDTSEELAREVPVFQYEFADPDAPALSPLPPSMPMGAYHSSELWSLFDLGGFEAQMSPEQHALAGQMIDYWAAFAATGDPGQADGPEWPAFDAGDSAYIQALAPGDGGVGPVDGRADHRCGFWADLQE
ncbi:carboxylesterase/lipase family protein [Actinoalloteichus hymeniacidonis]|uniref:Carboxylic ester hydrolase n=1 Tax=Actinoalloteichus hymeniacidonis TaxID=340345 RepID=A0AAC9HR63_9PSEU|nr:carboxylesterase family protein [Actinoalloteichus hymeniacidonis]AOS63818.1 carboxylesterase type B [Actinoalloteichus hymeniacidonis]MBB5908128.1 para-nitrobenzyl esterase [Actinoalloteichus hymeniacidonis]